MPATPMTLTSEEPIAIIEVVMPRLISHVIATIVTGAIQK